MPSNGPPQPPCWQALNAQPQDMLRDSQRLKSLESDVAAMLAQSRKTEQAVTDLRGQLEQARQERYSNWLVYALGAVLLFALLAAGLLWRRDRQHALRFSHGPWWDKNDEQSDFAIHSGPVSGHVGTVAAREEHPARPVVDLDLDALHFESTRKLPASRPAEADRPEFLPSLGGLSGMLRYRQCRRAF